MILQIIGIRIQHEGKWYKLRDTYDWFDILKDVYSVWSRFLSCVTKNREKERERRRNRNALLFYSVCPWPCQSGSDHRVVRMKCTHACTHRNTVRETLLLPDWLPLRSVTAHCRRKGEVCPEDLWQEVKPITLHAGAWVLQAQQPITPDF